MRTTASLSRLARQAWDSPQYFRAIQKFMCLLGTISAAWFLLGLLLTILLLAGAEVYFTRTQRAWIVVTQVLPSLIYLVGVYFLTETPPLAESHVNLWYYGPSLVVLTSLPSIALIARFGPAWGILCWLYSGPGMLLPTAYLVSRLARRSGAPRTRFQEILSAPLEHLLFVFWGRWAGAIHPDQRGALDDPGRIRGQRARMYQDKRGIEEFQATLTCPVLDAEAAAPDIWTRLSDSERKATLCVSDIGGGDGRFTRNLLAGLAERGAVFSEIRMADPVDCGETYAKEIRSAPQLAQCGIQFKMAAFPSGTASDGWADLAIASHSLYDACDAAMAEHGSIQEKVVNPLLGMIRTNGTAMVAFGSERGTAYRFKAEALKMLLGQDVRDMTIESLHSILRGNRDCCVSTPRYVDNVFDLTLALSSSQENGRCDVLSRWLSYFLRVDLASLGAHAQSATVSLLSKYCRRVSELSEAERTRYLRLGGFSIRDDSIVLPHKVGILLLWERVG